MRPRVNMPRWPAWVMGAAAAACAYPAVTTPAPVAQEHYEARGQEPGWHLVIDGGRIDYRGDYGEVRIAVPRPEPRPRDGGRRYEAGRLLVDIADARCTDIMSGQAYEHRVTVTADGRTFDGCGGARRPGSAPAEAVDADPASLDGTRWVLREIDGRPVPSAPPATLNFEGARFGGHGGCNHYGGRYRIDGRRIVVEEVASTLVGCQGPVGATEQGLFRGLATAFEVAHRPGRTLAIVRDGRAALLFVPPR